MSSIEFFIKSFVAGGVGGVCKLLVGHPFDTVKVRLQTMPQAEPGCKPMYGGAFDCVKKTVAREGVLALYKGMGAPMVSVLPNASFFFGMCALAKWLQRKDPDQVLSFKQNFAAGAFANTFGTIIVVPEERIKCLLQVQTNAKGAIVKYSGPRDVLVQLYKEGGIPCIYRGAFATLSRGVPSAGVYMGTYEFMKQQMSAAPMGIVLSGGCAGMAACTICLPFDVLKSRIQTSPLSKYPNGMRDAFKEVYREGGLRALYKGFVPAMLRSFPANAACFSGIEITMWMLRV